MTPYLIELLMKEMEERRRFEEMARKPTPQEYPAWMMDYLRQVPRTPVAPMPNQMTKEYPQGYGSVTPNMFHKWGREYKRP